LNVRRGDIYWVDFGNPTGSEQGGRRPALIIQNDIGNKSSTTTIIAAITSTQYNKKYPFLVEITKEESGLPKDSTVNLAQIRTISAARLINLIGRLSPNKMLEVDEAIRAILGLTNIK
jgi:mRNA interferase MazF